ncbi:hypothetical protein LOK49_LG06G03134 [Camellia lanceoleosa]|uniref:Uncharacterized protein n=1 Tax=Camellia lanceoleosa TaxID=1840588 RepID=A0ACC0H7C4_9ERIC|nr:hypothetical protein LOK49_LG06G03134 [Camellia lanceoleosa]
MQVLLNSLYGGDPWPHSQELASAVLVGLLFDLLQAATQSPAGRRLPWLFGKLFLVGCSGIPLCGSK